MVCGGLACTTPLLLEGLHGVWWASMYYPSPMEGLHGVWWASVYYPSPIWGAHLGGGQTGL